MAAGQLGLRHLAGSHRRRLAGAATLIVVGAVLELARPWPLKVAVDNGIGGAPLPAWLAPLDGLSATAIAILAGLTTVALTALAAAAVFASTVLVVRAAEGIGSNLRGHLVERLLDLSPRFHDKHRSGDLVSRIVADVYRVEDAVVAWWETAVPETLVVLGTLAVLLAVDPVLALAALVVCPALAWVIAVRRRLVRTAQRQARDQEGLLAAHATDLLRNIRVVQAFSQQVRARRDFDRLNDVSRASSVRAQEVEARLVPLADLVLAGGAATVLVLGVGRVVDGQLSLGTLLVVLSYVAGLYSPLRSLSRLSTTLARGAASLDRINDVMSSTEVVVEPLDARPAPPMTRSLTFEGVSFGYYPEAPVLRGLDLTVRAGETVALLGPTGAGKSTLLSLVLRFHDPDAGRILIDDVDVREYDLGSLRNRMAYVPQESWFLDTTIAENIALGRSAATRQEIEQAGRTALVDEFVDRLPRGYDTVVGESGLLLSGGQRRRIALARAVLRGADLLLLDEPTAGLDDTSAGVVMHAVAMSSRGRTVVMVTHDTDLAATTDRVVTLETLGGPTPPNGTVPLDGAAVPLEALTLGRR